MKKKTMLKMQMKMTLMLKRKMTMTPERKQMNKKRTEMTETMVRGIWK